MTDTAPETFDFEDFKLLMIKQIADSMTGQIRAKFDSLSAKEKGAMADGVAWALHILVLEKLNNPEADLQSGGDAISALIDTLNAELKDSTDGE